MMQSNLTERFSLDSDPQPESLPEDPPEPLLNGFIPPIKQREPIAPDHPTCDAQTGDLLVIQIGSDSLKYYGFLILSVYVNEVIGINLHNHNYSSRDVDSWIEWFDKYRENGDFEDGTKRLYKNIAPIAPDS